MEHRSYYDQVLLAFYKMQYESGLIPSFDEYIFKAIDQIRKDAIAFTKAEIDNARSKQWQEQENEIQVLNEKLAETKKALEFKEKCLKDTERLLIDSNNNSVKNASELTRLRKLVPTDFEREKKELWLELVRNKGIDTAEKAIKCFEVRFGKKTINKRKP